VTSIASYIESQDWLADLPPFHRHDWGWSQEHRDYHESVYGIELDRIQRVGIQYYTDLLVSLALQDFADTEGASRGDELAEAIAELRRVPYGGESEGTPAVRRFMFKKIFFKEFRRELHRLLCSDGKTAVAQRESILKEAKIGQSSIAVTIASMIAPTLGTNGGVIAGAVAVALAVIGRVGLSAWCATQSGS